MRFYEDWKDIDTDNPIKEYELFEVFCDPLVDEETFKPLIIEAVKVFSSRGEYSTANKHVYFRGALHPWTEDGPLRNLCKGLLNGVTEDFREYMGYDV